MKTVVLWALVALNVMLGLSLFNRYAGENTANAQVGAARRPGEYIMIDGTINGASSGIVYVVDTVNGQLSALTLKDADPNGKLDSMPPIDLEQLFSTNPNGVTGTVRPKRGY